MLILAQHLWPALATAALFGAILAGSLSGGVSGRAERFAAALLPVVLAGLIVASARGVLSGRAGLWLDAGAALLGCYLAGCCLGCAFSRWTRAGRA